MGRQLDAHKPWHLTRSQFSASQYLCAAHGASGATAPLSFGCLWLLMGRPGVSSDCPKLNVDVQMTLSRSRDMDN